MQNTHYSSLWQPCGKDETKTNLKILDINRQWWTIGLRLSAQVWGCSGEGRAAEAKALDSIVHKLNAHLHSALKLMELFWS